MPDLFDRRIPRWSVQCLEVDIYAESSRKPREARMRTLHQMLQQWGLTSLPLDFVKLRAVAATLKQGGYRTAASYLRLYLVEAEKSGQAIPNHLRRAVRDFFRTCERGGGGRGAFEAATLPNGTLTLTTWRS